MKNETKIIHKGRNSTRHFGSVNPPIVSSSTLIFPTVETYEKAEDGNQFYKSVFDSPTTDPAYGIAGNETNFALQEVINSLEGGFATLLTSSGLSAITVVMLAFLKAGDHLLVTDAVYGPTRRFCNKTLKDFGVETTYYNPTDIESLESAIKPNTRLIFMESPGSLTFEVQDLGETVKIAREKNIITVIDNSWATPIYLKPLDLGIDISIHAVTKFINGHSDILMGSVTCNKDAYKKVAVSYKNLGMYVSPRDCYEALRGVRTLSARLDYQKRSLEKVLAYLEKSPFVKEILSPANPKFSGHTNWKKYYSGATSLFSITIDKKYSEESVKKMIDSYNHFGIGASWGGFESLVRRVTLDHVRTATIGKYPDHIVRLYLGLENPDDLISDLEKGFSLLHR